MSASDTWALVTHGPASGGQWKLQPVIPRELQEDEVLVRVVACGICLADVHVGDARPEEAVGNPGIWYPRVLGHEGSGYVEKVGRAVTSVKPSDPVILSFAYCGECYNCLDGHPAYCTRLFDLNFVGERGVYASHSHSDSRHFNIGGSFFGQSSFASRAIVKQRCLVNLAGLEATPQELEILAPLGCGIQTGTGAFINIADAQPQHEVAVLGVGGVGQSAIMAAAMRQCKTIIAIDRSPSRLQLAKLLGATHVIDTSDPHVNLVEEVKQITGGRGVHVSLDTTGVQTLARQSWEFVRNHGKVLQVGLARPDDLWNISMADHMNSGKQIIGCVEGDAIPQKYILDMIKWFRQGKLPVDKLVRQYPIEQYDRALQDMQQGATVKAVLVWPRDGLAHL